MFETDVVEGVQVVRLMLKVEVEVVGMRRIYIWRKRWLNERRNNHNKRPSKWHDIQNDSVSSEIYALNERAK